MKYKFLLSGETPSKKNSRRTLSNGKTIPSKGFMIWHEQHYFELVKQKKPTVPLNRNLFIKMKFVHGDLVRRDSDNQATSVLDLLKDIQIIEDDNWRIVSKIEIENLYEKGKSRCLVEITENKKSQKSKKGK